MKYPDCEIHRMPQRTPEWFSIRRGILGIRVSGGKLMAQWELVADYVRKPALRTETGKVTPKGISEVSIS